MSHLWFAVRIVKHSQRLFFNLWSWWRSMWCFFLLVRLLGSFRCIPVFFWFWCLRWSAILIFRQIWLLVVIRGFLQECIHCALVIDSANLEVLVTRWRLKSHAIVLLLLLWVPKGLKFGKKILWRVVLFSKHLLNLFIKMTQLIWLKDNAAYINWFSTLDKLISSSKCDP